MINNNYNTKLKQEMKNENRTMTPLSKRLYKSMKIDPLGRFVEGKTNRSYAFMVDMA